MPPLVLTQLAQASSPSSAPWNRPGTGPVMVAIWPIVMVVGVTPGPLSVPVIFTGGGMVAPLWPVVPCVLPVLLFADVFELLHAARRSPAPQTNATPRFNLLTVFVSPYLVVA